MTTISALPSSIVDWLNELDFSYDIKFLTEYPPQYKAVPLLKPIVSVGVNKISITDHFTDNGQGVLERDEYCRTASIEIVLSIHVPFSEGGEKCHEVFTNVVDNLTFASDLNIVQSRCEKITSDRDTDALVMNAYITVNSDFCPAEDPANNYQTFLDKELLCGSHIRDTQIHITQSEREKWNGVHVCGTYTGTGSSEKDITLGYKPAFLAVFTPNRFPTENVTSDDRAQLYTAFACGNYASKGIDLMNTGFRIYNDSRASNSYGILNLNEAGRTYCYFAIKPT